MAEITEYGSDRTSNGIDIIAGIWLILAPFLLGYNFLAQATWNSVIVGALIVILAVASFAALRSVSTRWINALLGAWLFFSPFILNYSESASALWNSLIVGAIVVVFSVWGASIAASHQSQQMRTH